MTYDPAYYGSVTEDAATSAAKILPRVFGLFDSPPSVVDVGCGEGSWLREARSLGATIAWGIDQEAARDGLVIPEEDFIAFDLERLGDEDLGEGLGEWLPRSFDLALCLEVGEHLSPAAAAPLVTFLCDVADVVLFSAAIPLQGGEGHINETPCNLWWDLFADRGFMGTASLRSEFWGDPEIAYWYRQNLLLFGRATKVFPWMPIGEQPPVAAHHPDWARQQQEAIVSLQGHLRSQKEAVAHLRAYLAEREAYILTLEKAARNKRR